MRALLMLIFVSFTFYKTCSQTESVIQPELSYDTSNIAIIPFNVKNFYGELDPTNTPSTLTQEDISEIDKIFRQSIIKYDSALSGNNKKYFSIGDPTRYKRQYVCYLDRNGDKIVYVDCFCSSLGIDWHKDLMVVDDGGNCFFNMKINLTTRNYFDFIVNGYA